MSATPGASLSTTEETQTRPVSDAPGVNLGTRTRPVSLAPRVPSPAPERASEVTADMSEPARTDGLLSLVVAPLFPSGRKTESTQPMQPEFTANKVVAVATPLVEVAGVHGNTREALTGPETLIGAATETVGSQGPTNITNSMLVNNEAFSRERPAFTGPSSVDHIGPCNGHNVDIIVDHTGILLGPNNVKAITGEPNSTQQIDSDTPLSKDNFCDPTMPPPNYNLPPNFNWVFMHGIWTLVPCQFSKDIQSWSSREEDRPQTEQLELWSEENHIETMATNNDNLELEESGHDVVSSDNST